MIRFELSIPAPSDQSLAAARQILAANDSRADVNILAEEIVRLHKAAETSNRQLSELLRELERQTAQGKVAMFRPGH